MSAERKDWLAERRKGIGASEVAALFHAHPYMSLFSLWESKVSEPKADEEAEDRRADGLLMEPRIAAKYARKTGRIVLSPPDKIVANPSCPLMLASLDRVVVFTTNRPDEMSARALESGAPEEEKQRGPLELKWWDNFRDGDEIPAYGQIQCQAQMACFGSTVGSIAILGSYRSFHYADLAINPAFVALLREKIEEFWERHVKTGIPPDADGSKATSEALRRLYPKERGTAVLLPPEASTRIVDGRPVLGWADRRDKLKKAIKYLEEMETQLSNELRAAIGDNSYGVLDDGTGLSLATTKGSTYMVTKQDYRTLRRVKTIPKGLLP